MNATDKQRRAALARANEIRIARANHKKRIAAREDSAIEVILAPDDYFETATLMELLRAIPKYGRARILKLTRHFNIPPHRRVGDLTYRQRALIADYLRERGVE